MFVAPGLLQQVNLMWLSCRRSSTAGGHMTAGHVTSPHIPTKVTWHPHTPTNQLTSCKHEAIRVNDVSYMRLDQIITLTVLTRTPNQRDGVCWDQNQRDGEWIIWQEQEVKLRSLFNGTVRVLIYKSIRADNTLINQSKWYFIETGRSTAQYRRCLNPNQWSISYWCFSVISFSSVTQVRGRGADVLKFVRMYIFNIVLYISLIMESVCTWLLCSIFNSEVALQDSTCGQHKVRNRCSIMCTDESWHLVSFWYHFEVWCSILHWQSPVALLLSQQVSQTLAWAGAFRAQQTSVLRNSFLCNCVSFELKPDWAEEL